LYYLFAWQQWVAQYGEETPMHIIVPSGNFGNICAGMMAKASGLPLGHFVAACNANNVVTRYLATEKYEVHKSVVTISNAMDVGNPSNFVRILEIMQNNFEHLKNTLSSYSFDDVATKATITRVYNDYGYTLDPHGAVAFLAAETFVPTHGPTIVLETAHPVKFPEVVEEAIGQKLAIPASVQYLLDKPKQSIPLAADYAAFKSWMIDN
jgi:threonine synthase